MRKVKHLRGLLFQGIPIILSEKLIEEFLEMKRHFLMGDWKPGQLMGGRFAETAIRIFQHILQEPVTPFGSEIPNNEKTRILNTVQNHPAVNSHIRQKATVIVRLLLDFRNNRDVAHLGGFNANGPDALFVMTGATWTMCEFVRVFGGLTMGDAQKIVDELSVKEYPAIMEFDGDVFITKHNLTAKQEVLVLLCKFDKLGYRFLFAKTKDANASRFKTALCKLEKEKYIGKKNGQYFIMPRGIKVVQQKKLLFFR